MDYNKSFCLNSLHVNYVQQLALRQDLYHIYAFLFACQSCIILCSCTELLVVSLLVQSKIERCITSIFDTSGLHLIYTVKLAYTVIFEHNTMYSLEL